MIRDLKYIKRRLRISQKVRILDIDQSGVDEFGDSYIKLRGGPIFYGPSPKRKLYKYYALLPGKIKAQIPFECFQVGMDIVVRYIEGGLRVGGPKKEQYYKAKHGDKVAEMGAYRGYYTLYLADRVGPDGLILAIEPIPDNLYYLKKNILANNINNVEISSLGVWSGPDEKEFSRRPQDYQSASIDLKYNHENSYTIKVDSLDNILYSHDISELDFVLIQLNGAEYEAIKGLTKIKPKHLAIAARYNTDELDVASEIEVELTKRGYRCSVKENRFVFGTLIP